MDLKFLRSDGELTLYKTNTGLFIGFSIFTEDWVEYNSINEYLTDVADHIASVISYPCWI